MHAVSAGWGKLQILDDEWADATTRQGRLMLTVLGGLAEFERHLILTRTAEGAHSR
jgi:DNA invertase Pin-like site-specific DNA recombinase